MAWLKRTPLVHGDDLCLPGDGDTATYRVAEGEWADASASRDEQAQTSEPNVIDPYGDNSEASMSLIAPSAMSGKFRAGMLLT